MNASVRVAIAHDGLGVPTAVGLGGAPVDERRLENDGAQRVAQIVGDDAKQIFLRRGGSSGALGGVLLAPVHSR